MNTMNRKPSKTLRRFCYVLVGLVAVFYIWIGILLFLFGCKPIKESPTSLSPSGMGLSTSTEENSLAADCNESLTTSVAEKVLRLHIIAESNSEADQQVKYQIRDAVIAYIKPYLSNAESKEDAVTILNEHLPDFVTLANRLLETEGFAYRAQAAIGKSYFPIKQYGDLILPAGEYDALKITLGSASGKNWWCIVFPQLCFVDTVTGKLPVSAHEEMKEFFSEEEYAMVFPAETLRTEKKKTTPKIRFWFWEQWKKRWGDSLDFSRPVA